MNAPARDAKGSLSVGCLQSGLPFQKDTHTGDGAKPRSAAVCRRYATRARNWLLGTQEYAYPSHRWLGMPLFRIGIPTLGIPIAVTAIRPG